MPARGCTSDEADHSRAIEPRHSVGGYVSAAPIADWFSIEHYCDRSMSWRVLFPPISQKTMSGRSRCAPVVIQQSTEALLTMYATTSDNWWTINQGVLETLMVPLAMEGATNSGHRSLEVSDVGNVRGRQAMTTSCRQCWLRGHATNIICSSGAPPLDVRLRQVQPGFWARPAKICSHTKIVSSRL